MSNLRKIHSDFVPCYGRIHQSRGWLAAGRYWSCRHRTNIRRHPVGIRCTHSDNLNTFTSFTSQKSYQLTMCSVVHPLDASIHQFRHADHCVHDPCFFRTAEFSFLYSVRNEQIIADHVILVEPTTSSCAHSPSIDRLSRYFQEESYNTVCTIWKSCERAPTRGSCKSVLFSRYT